MLENGNDDFSNKEWYVGVVTNTGLVLSDSRYRIGNIRYEMWFEKEIEREFTYLFHQAGDVLNQETASLLPIERI
jgi:hypothetical protein